jgi:L-aspartate oxidase
MSSPSVVIVGGGLAGLFCALKLSPRPVTVLATSPLGEGASSAWAQGGIAAAMAEGDTPEKHTADTLAAGGGIVDAAITLGMAREAGDRVRDLLSFGVPFDKDLAGHLVQSREAAHSERRIVRVRGDMAGAAIMQALITAVRTTPSISVLEGITAEHLLTEGGQVTGVAAADEAGNRTYYHASDVVLATGGIGHLYAMTTNPKEACGNGISMAAEAGAVIADAEFVQFHPTAMAIGRDPAPLATEALRGEGATLINKAGKRFMLALHKDAELGPRDIVARGVFAELQAGRGAFLDCRTAIGERFAEAFPTVYATCQSAGINPITDLIPIAPAEHYHMGGVLTSSEGRSTCEGLWAIGEVASTGVHGANRLASNSLLEAIVFAARVAEALPAALHPVTSTPMGKAPAIPFDPDLVAMLRQTMSDHLGVIRNTTGLMTAIWTLADIEATGEAPELTAMARAALCIAAAAYARQESRGGHYRSDYPEANPALAHRSMFTFDQVRAIVAGVVG